ncbi:unnamed protein product [Darwinula stevensoni]|uniref:Carbonic anhydrase n=1 Tax=Darwinula stevensoni TaxID=69355 RepID=A0A7R9FQV8_9CRUS|nr:unnamed protein product [Darwinula stevensoni]CAG0900485.1 unnamed protein product [Darwinula stevensoni]
MCGGPSQSPLDLGNVTFADLGIFRFQGYGLLPTSVNVTNNGQTAHVTLKTKNPLKLSGGSLPGEYVFDQLHFHWGSSLDRGSEHTIEGTKFPMEMHMVHYNAKFKNVTEATASGEQTAFAVLGFFFEVAVT